MVPILTQLSFADYPQFSEFEYLGGLQDFMNVLRNIPDEKLIHILECKRGKGRDDYPIPVMWRLFLAQRFFGHKTVASLRRELDRNSQLRRVCGLEYCKGKHLIPSDRVFTNFKKLLIECRDARLDIFDELKEYMYDNMEDFGKEIAADGKIIETYANQIYKGKKEEVDERTDTDAKYIKKQYYYIDKKTAQEKIKTLSFLGYKIHIMSCAVTELPIAYEVTQANKGEREQLLKLLKKLPKEHLNSIEYLMADRGYDSIEMVQWLKRHDIKAIIDIRNLWRGEKTRQYKDSDIVYTFDGKMYMVEDEKTMKPMSYRGYDKKRDALRYEYKGKIYRIHCKEDERVFTQVARSSNKFKRLYKKRTSIERLNGRIDRDYVMEEHCIRGIEKVTLEMDTVMMMMLAVAKTRHKNGRIKDIRKLMN